MASSFAVQAPAQARAQAMHRLTRHPVTVTSTGTVVHDGVAVQVEYLVRRAVPHPIVWDTQGRRAEGGGWRSTAVDDNG